MSEEGSAWAKGRFKEGDEIQVAVPLILYRDGAGENRWMVFGVSDFDVRDPESMKVIEADARNDIESDGGTVIRFRWLWKEVIL